MNKRIILIYFEIWLGEQDTNSADDLLLEVSQLDSLPDHLTFLPLIPVDVPLASECVIAKIQELQAEYIRCFGMAAQGR